MSISTLTVSGRQVAVLSSVLASTWPADKNGPLPKKFRILKRDDNPSTKGNFRVTAATDRDLERNQRALGFERVAIDYNHSTVEGSPEYVKGQPAAVLGYCDIRVKPDGVYAESVDWTPLGEKVARNFEDISPALATDADGSVTFIHSIAMTPNGCLADSQIRNLINNSASSKRDAAAQLTGRARIIAANERERANTRRLLTNSAETACDAVQSNAKKPLRGYARMVAGFERENLIRLQANKVPLTLMHSKDIGASALAERLFELHATVNPDTHEPYSLQQLTSLPLEQLRALLANSPRKLHGRDLITYGLEQQQQK